MASVTTTRLGLTTWTADTDAPTVYEFTNNNLILDNILSLFIADTLANRNNHRAVVGLKFYATDVNQWFRYNGASWCPLLLSFDTNVLSTALPAPSQDGLYYYATDTNVPYRDNGASLIALTTQVPAQFPVGTIAFYPVPAQCVTTNGTLYVPNTGGTSVPPLPQGWMYCDGSALSTSTYGTLFATIGHTFSFTGWTLQMLDGSGKTYNFGTSFPSLTGIKNAMSSVGESFTVDSFNPNIVVSPAWQIIPTGNVSSGSTFNLPIGICYPTYQYSQDVNAGNFPNCPSASYGLAQEVNVTNSWGWPAINSPSSEPPPANPWLTDGSPTAIFAVIVKTS